MVETKSNATDFSKYVPGKWTGRLLYEGEWDENYSLTVTGALDKHNVIKGMPCA